MILSSNSSGITGFPAQKKTDKQKTEKWFQSCVDAGIALIDSKSGGKIRKSKKEMKILYDLLIGKINPEDKKAITNPINIQGYKFPGTARTYPLIAPLQALLAGEERNRTHFLNVGLVNADGISQKQDFLNKELNQILIKGMQEGTKEEIQAKIQEFGKWSKFTYKDKRERMAFQVLEYLNKSLNMDNMFNRGFENLLTVGEVFYVCDIVEGEPTVRLGDPLNFTFIGSNNTPYPEDCSIIIEDGYVNLGTILDEYYEYLTDAQIKSLEEGTASTQSLAKSLWKTPQTIQPDINLDKLIDENGGIGSIIGLDNLANIGNLSGAYNTDGQIRRTRVLWASMRKIGILSYLDENGELQKTEVSETYVPNESIGEKVKWVWIKEWMEGTKVGDFYLKMQPRPVQFRSMTNLSTSNPGIVGVINNINSSKVTSFASALKPLQYMYDEYMYRMQTAFMTSYGNIARLDVSQIPDGWDMDKWMYYATVLKWAVQDPMKEGDEGAAKGMLAGNVNQQSNTFNLDQGNLIQQNMLMLEFIERRANDIAGISPQRKGAISNRETVGGVERAVVQSSHRTEKWFSLQDYARLRTEQILLETAKVAWREKKFKRTYVLDDMSQAVLDFDSKIFNEGEYGVMVNDAKEDTQIKNMITNSMDSLLQRGIKLSTVLDIARTRDISTAIRRVQYEEEQLEQSQQQQQAAQIKQLDENSKRVENIQLEKIAADERNNVRNNKTKLIIASEDPQQNVEKDNEDLKLKEEKFQEDIRIQQEKLRQDEEKLRETIRHNKATEKNKTT